MTVDVGEEPLKLLRYGVWFAFLAISFSPITAYYPPAG